MVEQSPLPLHGPALQRPGGCVPAWNAARNLPFQHPGIAELLIWYVASTIPALIYRYSTVLGGADS